MKSVKLLLAAMGVTGAIGAWGFGAADAHRTVVSPYTFRDAQPILARHCSQCHGTAAGAMPLHNFTEARDRSWLIRRALMTGSMPPWFGEGAFKAPPAISARELDTLMTWAAGATPEGPPLPPATPPHREPWPMGPPDLIVPIPAPFTLDGSRNHAAHEATIADASLRNRLIRAVDVMPGAPSIVRRAEIAIVERGRDQPVALWQPGDTPQALEGNAAFRAPSNGALRLRIDYKRRPDQEPVPISDRSEIGVYFAAPGARAVRSIDLTDPAAPAAGERTFSHRIDRTVRAVAIRPVTGPQGALVRISIVGARGARSQLALLRLRDGWERRYVFVSPVEITAGSRIEVHVTPAAPSLASLTGEPVAPDRPLRLALETVQ